MALNSKQRAQLRALANGIEPIFQIGKDGIGDNLAGELSLALEKRELVKLTILETADITAKEAIAILAEQTGAEPVQAIGRKLVLYKESEKHKRIELLR